MSVWPWEHLAFGYLCFGAAIRLTCGRSPTHRETIAVVVATQFPDLVDKPLSWTFDLLASGLSLAHSLAVAVPLAAFAMLLAYRRGVPGQGLAVAASYGSHLFGDALYPVVFGDPIRTAFLLWPVVEGPRDASMLGAVGHVLSALGRLELLASTPAGPWFLALELSLLGGALGLWVVDGYPGWPTVRNGLRRR